MMDKTKRRFRCERKGCPHKDYNIGDSRFCLIEGPFDMERPCPTVSAVLERRKLRSELKDWLFAGLYNNQS